MARLRVPGKPLKGLRAAIGWTAFWAGFGVFDALVPVSFSQTLRNVFGTDSRGGRIAFLGALAGAALIFAIHILYPKK